MFRETALVVSILITTIIYGMLRYGAQSSFFSSLSLSCFLFLILLNVFYPLSQAASDDANISLVFYVLFQVMGVLCLSLYLVYTCINL